MSIRQRVVALIAVIATCAGALVHALHYLPFISDDALISLRYSARLLQGKGLTWSDYERVEGYSNLLWVLLNAATRAIGIEPIFGARMLGVAFMLAAIVAVSLGAERPFRFKPSRALTGGLLLAISPPIAAWSIGGLEQPLVAGLLAIALHRLRAIEAEEARRDPLVLGVTLGLLALARADGFLFIGAFAVAIAIVSRVRVARLRSLAPALVVPLSFVAAQFLFRRAYYGDWLPNTAYAKVAFHPWRAYLGRIYVDDALWGFRPLVDIAVAIALTLAVIERRVVASRVAMILAGAGWAAHAAMIGGDIFPAYRQIVPVVVAIAFLVADVVEALETKARWLTYASAAGLLTFSAYRQIPDPQNVRAALEGWEWDGKITGLFFKRAFTGTGVTLATDPGGCVPFWSELEAFDMLGLNDRHLARNPPPDFGGGALGHELADGAYTFAKAPDLVLLCGPFGSVKACYPNGEALLEQAGFSKRYRLALFHGSEEDGPVRDFLTYVRVDSPKIGVVAKNNGDIAIPGYYFEGDPRPLTSFDGTFVTEIVAGKEAWFHDLDLPAGTWSIEAPAFGAAAMAGAWCGPSKIFGDPASPLVIEITAATTIAVGVAASSAHEATAFREMHVRKLADGAPAPRLRCPPP